MALSAFLLAYPTYSLPIHTHIHSLLLSGSLLICPYSKDLNTVIPALREKVVGSDIETQVQAQRLKEARRLREDLERKLQFVDEEIEGMTGSKSALSRHRSIGIADISEELKRRKSSEFVRKLHLAQQASNRRRDLQSSINAEEKMREVEEIRLKREEREKQAVKEREERVKLLQERAKRRKVYLEEVRNMCKQTALTPPARSIALPDLPTLPSARLLKQHPSPEDLKAHSQLYSHTKRIHQERKMREMEEKRLSEKVHVTINGRHYAEALEERRAQRELEAKRVTGRMLAREKQRRYAELVQEMYFPAIDPRKQEEVEQRKQGSVPRHRSSISPRLDTNRTSTDIPSIKLDDTQIPKPPVPRFPHGKKLSPPRTPEPPRHIDYLAELRRDSINKSHQALQSIHLSTQEWTDLLTVDSPAGLQAKLTQLEATAKRHEVAVSHLSAVDKEAIAAEAGLNSLLVHSIRAKLALLRTCLG